MNYYILKYTRIVVIGIVVFHYYVKYICLYNILRFWQKCHELYSLSLLFKDAELRPVKVTVYDLVNNRNLMIKLNYHLEDKKFVHRLQNLP